MDHKNSGLNMKRWWFIVEQKAIEREREMGRERELNNSCFARSQAKRAALSIRALFKQLALVGHLLCIWFGWCAFLASTRSDLEQRLSQDMREISDLRRLVAHEMRTSRVNFDMSISLDAGLHGAQDWTKIEDQDSSFSWLYWDIILWVVDLDLEVFLFGVLEFDWIFGGIIGFWEDSFGMIEFSQRSLWGK